jgi:hypothetical protein
LSGFVVLVNGNGTEPANRDSVIVTIEGTSLSALTDSLGAWSIGGVETGIYNIAFNKSGYGTTKITQRQFTGGGQISVGTEYLCKAPAFNVDSLWVRPPKAADPYSLYIGVKLSDTTASSMGPYRTFIFLQRDTSVAMDPAHYAAVFTINTYFKDGVDSTNAKIQPVNFSNGGFVSGDSIYAAAYLANAGSFTSGYEDLATGKTIYTNLNGVRSKVVRVVVP